MHFPVFWVIEFVHEFNNTQHRVHYKYQNFTEQIAMVRGCWYNANMLTTVRISAREQPRHYHFEKWGFFPILFTVHSSLV